MQNYKQVTLLSLRLHKSFSTHRLCSHPTTPSAHAFLFSYSHPKLSTHANPTWILNSPTDLPTATKHNDTARYRKHHAGSYFHCFTAEYVPHIHSCFFQVSLLNLVTGFFWGLYWNFSSESNPNQLAVGDCNGLWYQSMPWNHLPLKYKDIKFLSLLQ